jgi:hypothetical protein
MLIAVFTQKADPADGLVGVTIGVLSVAFPLPA